MQKQMIFDACERLWFAPDARAQIREQFLQEYQDFDARVMVLDDDPTGVQTVHDMAVYTAWDRETLLSALQSGEKLFFVLTNSRSFSAEKTAGAHAEIARNAAEAAKIADAALMLISRGDSTLRGHYPLETRVLCENLETNGFAPFAGEVLCPFFKEGGRFTIDGVHYVQEGDALTPAAQTEFARDRTFGYAHSDLAGYIAEKSGGKIAPEQVVSLTLRELRGGNLDEIAEKLASIAHFHYIACDAIEEADVQALAVILMKLRKLGKNYCIRSAAAVPKVLGNVSDRPLLTRTEMTDASATNGGLVIVGSHVQKTTAQLWELQKSDVPLKNIEFCVENWAVPGGLAAETRRCVALAEEAMRAGKTAVVYTSRKLVMPENATPEELLAISVRISDALTDVVAKLRIRPRFLIAKGGITSSDVGTKALRVKRATVLGQAQPGIPVWKTGAESLFPGLSYIIFPGNVGGVGTLRTIVEMLA